MRRSPPTARIDVDALVEAAYAVTDDDEAAALDERLATAADAVEDHDRSRLLLARATLDIAPDAVLRVGGEEAAATFEVLGDHARSAQASAAAADFARRLDDVVAALDHIVAALVALERVVDDDVASDVLHQLAVVAGELCGYDDALALHERAGAAARRIASRRRVERAIHALADTLLTSVRLERLAGLEVDAESRLARAEGLARELCSTVDTDAYLADGPRLLADILCEQGRPEEAWLALMAAPGATDRHLSASRVAVEARCLRLLGQPLRAIASLDDALAQSTDRADNPGVLFALDERSLAREAVGDAGGALDDARTVAAFLWQLRRRSGATLLRRAAAASEREVERRLVLRSSEVDPLTDVGNRHAFERRIDRSGDQVVVGVVLVDVDHLDDVNTRYGRAVGDEVLARVASLVRLEVRDRDLVARYGGDELGVVLGGLDLPAVHAVAERIRRRVAEHAWRTWADDLAVTVSVGLAAGPGRDARRLVQRADVSLFEAKRAGCDRVAWAGG